MNDLLIKKLKLYKYKIDDIIIIYAGKRFKIKKEFVTSFFIEKDFDENTFPIFRIQCLVNDNYRILLNQPDCEYIINIKKGSLGVQTNENEVKSNIVYEEFINDRFINVNSGDKSISLTDDFNNMIIREDKTTDDGLQNNTNKVDLYLFKPRVVDRCRHLQDMIFTNVSVAQVLIALLQDNIPGRCLISYPHNTNMYSNIIIPNNVGLKGGIKYLQDVYGIYDNGYMLFVDFDISYMLSKSIASDAYKIRETIKVYINFTPIDDLQGNIYGQFYDAPSDSYNVYSLNEPKIIDKVHDIDKNLYNEINAIDTYKRRRQDVNLVNNTPIDNSIKIVDDKYNNPHIIRSHMYELDLLNNILEVELNEVDLDILKPNKEFIIKFNKNTKNSKKKEGKYKLIKYVATFTKSDNEMFVCAANITFMTR